MYLKELISQGWQSLMRDRMRSALTMLGIVWGLASVVLLLAYGQGLGGCVGRERKGHCGKCGAGDEPGQSIDVHMILPFFITEATQRRQQGDAWRRRCVAAVKVTRQGYSPEDGAFKG